MAKRGGAGTSLGETRTFDSYFTLRYDRVTSVCVATRPPRWKARETDMDEMHEPRTTRKKGNAREGRRRRRKEQETNEVDIRYDGK